MNKPSAGVGASLGPLILGLFGGIGLGAAAVALLLESGGLPGGLAVLALAVAAAGVAVVAVLKRRLVMLEAELRGFRQQTSRELGTLRRVSEAVRRDVAKQIFEPFDYWEARIAEHGPAGVGDLSRPLAELEEDTRLEKGGLLPFFASQLRGDEARVLDFGCGFGRFTSELAALVSEGATGVDATPALIEEAQRRATSDRATFVQARGSLPFPDGHFDAIWVAYVLIHVVGENKRRTAEELARVLKPGGLLFMTEGVTTWRRGSAHCEFEPFEWYAQAFPFDLVAYRRDDVFRAGSRGGFEHLGALDGASRDEALRKAEADNHDLHWVMTGRKPL